MSASLLVELQPREALLFRDTRPFNAGAQSTARAQLPEPGTLFGAARTAALQPLCADLHDFARGRRCQSCLHASTCAAVRLAGPPGEAGGAAYQGTLRALGTFMTDERFPSQLFVPCPAHITTLPTPSNRAPLVTLRSPTPVPGQWSASLPEVALPGTASRGVKPDWVSVAALDALLSGRLVLGAAPEWATSGREPLFTPEPRIGLARDPSGVAMEGYLYRAEFRRYHPAVRIAVAVDTEDGLTWPPVAFLGGRSRMADLQVHSIQWPPLPPPPAMPGRYAVAIVTPAWFSSGWHPQLPSGARLACAVVPAHITSQGWDVARNRPRPLRWACPAGSVWWVDAETPAAAETIVSWHGTALCEDRPAAGYGTAFVRRWEPNNGTS